MPSTFPFEPVRDLLGILRAMWSEERSRPMPSERRLVRIEQLARQLQRATELAETHDPGTAPYEKALSMAEGVVFRLAEVVSVTTTLEPVLRAAGNRVRRDRRGPSEREVKWAMGKQRH